MREFIYFLASLAGAAVLTALAVLIEKQSPIWGELLWGGTVLLGICAILLLIDIILKRPSFGNRSLRWFLRRQSIQSLPDATVPISGYLTAHDAVHYLADESQWGSQREASDALLLAPQEFKEKASEGRISVYGFSSKTKLHELIPKTHWMSYGLDLSTIYFPESQRETKTVPASYELGLPAPAYSDLNIVAADVYQVWPHSDKAEFDAAFDFAVLSREDAIKRLWQLRREGVVIRNEPISSEQQFSAWKSKYENWRASVLLVAEKFNDNLRPRLEVLDQIRPPPELPFFNQEHGRCVAIASEMLLRLEHALP